MLIIISILVSLKTFLDMFYDLGVIHGGGDENPVFWDVTL
jgi:hypothetical protein